MFLCIKWPSKKTKWTLKLANPSVVKRKLLCDLMRSLNIFSQNLLKTKCAAQWQRRVIKMKVKCCLFVWRSNSATIAVLNTDFIHESITDWVDKTFVLVTGKQMHLEKKKSNFNLLKNNVGVTFKLKHNWLMHWK